MTQSELPSKNIIPHKSPTLFDDVDQGTYSDMYASALPLIWKMQRQLHRGNQVVSYRYVGWITSIFKENTQKTKLTFLPVIRNPITQFSTIIECIYQSQKYAAACNMKYIHITADEGAACKFYQVVWNNPIEFKDVIVHLGDFHAMQELFCIIVKIVSSSGFEDVLYQADLCTSGSIKGVLAGKHYNRAWAVHECLSEALHRLFIEKEVELFSFTGEIEQLIKKVQDRQSCKHLIQDQGFVAYVANQYEKVKKKYLSGEKGKTAQYWMSYLYLVELQHQFHYSINTNAKFELQIHNVFVPACQYVCYPKLNTSHILKR